MREGFGRVNSKNIVNVIDVDYRYSQVILSYELIEMLYIVSLSTFCLNVLTFISAYIKAAQLQKLWIVINGSKHPGVFH